MNIRLATIVLLCMVCIQAKAQTFPEEKDGSPVYYRIMSAATDYAGQGRCLALLPEFSSRQHYGQLPQGNHQEIHQESHPDDQAGLAKSPYLGDAVVQDVRDGETQHPGRHSKRAKLEYLRLEQITGNQTGTEQHPHYHQGYTHGFLLFHFLFFFKKRLPSTLRVNINYLLPFRCFLHAPGVQPKRRIKARWKRLM